MGLIAIAFLGSTIGMLLGTAWETIRHWFTRGSARAARQSRRDAAGRNALRIPSFDPPTESGRA